MCQAEVHGRGCSCSLLTDVFPGSCWLAVGVSRAWGMKNEWCALHRTGFTQTAS